MVERIEMENKKKTWDEKVRLTDQSPKKEYDPLVKREVERCE